MFVEQTDSNMNTLKPRSETTLQTSTNAVLRFHFASGFPGISRYESQRVHRLSHAEEMGEVSTLSLSLN